MTAQEERRQQMLNGPIGPVLLRMAGPMTIGILSIVLFTVVDTFFVGQLGTYELAAMGFIFPVVFLVMSVAIGMGVGMTAVVSRVIGEGDREQVRCLTTDGLLLANTIVVMVAGAGLLTIGPLFRAIGAAPDTIGLIRSYMVPWYIGVGFLVIPMVGNAAIRATGDTKTPSMIMIIAGIINVTLDPLLIFGLGPFPRLELQGAAIATVIAWAATFAAALWILVRREKMIALGVPPLARLWDSWKRMLYVGVPAAGTQALIPLGVGVLTRLVSEFGPESVAAYGVAGRIESMSLVGIMGMGASVTPFVGQNFGAGNCERIRKTVRFLVKSALIYGIAVAAVLAIVAKPLAGAFNEDPVVRELITRYVWIVPPTYTFYAMMLLVNPMFNALNQPLRATFLIVLRLFVFALPFAYLGSRTAGVEGIFMGVAVANVAVGVSAFFVARSTVGLAEKAIAADVRYSEH